MPKYDYKCSACGRVYEKREGFDAPVLQECPECQGQARRLLSVPAIVFKGSGWYVNDSRKESPRDAVGTAATAETKTDGKAEAKPDGKTESKTESKSESKSEPRSESKGESRSGSKSESKSGSSASTSTASAAAD